MGYISRIDFILHFAIYWSFIFIYTEDIDLTGSRDDGPEKSINTLFWYLWLMLLCISNNCEKHDISFLATHADTYWDSQELSGTLQNCWTIHVFESTDNLFASSLKKLPKYAKICIRNLPSGIYQLTTF